MVVVLHPSKALELETGIDFAILSRCITLAFEAIYAKRFNVILKVYKSRKGYDYYQTACEEPTIYIYLPSEKRTEYDIIDSIIHESRHWQQEKILKVNFHDPALYDDTGDHDAYYNSPVEIDARSFEKVTKMVYQMYVALCELRLENERHKFFKLHDALRIKTD